jgi:hypothetical protein
MRAWVRRIPLRKIGKNCHCWLAHFGRGTDMPAAMLYAANCSESDHACAGGRNENLLGSADAGTRGYC